MRERHTHTLTGRDRKTESNRQTEREREGERQTGEDISKGRHGDMWIGWKSNQTGKHRNKERV